MDSLAIPARLGYSSWSALFKKIMHFGTSDEAANTRRQAGATTPVVWDGKLNSACSAQWLGMTLRAKEVTRTHWWWSVCDDQTDSVIMDSRMTYTRTTTGKKARRAAEQAARQWLERDNEDAE